MKGLLSRDLLVSTQGAIYIENVVRSRINLVRASRSVSSYDGIPFSYKVAVMNPAKIHWRNASI